MQSNKDVRHENLCLLVKRTPRGQTGLIEKLGECCKISQQKISDIKVW